MYRAQLCYDDIRPHFSPARGKPIAALGKISQSYCCFASGRPFRRPHPGYRIPIELNDSRPSWAQEAGLDPYSTGFTCLFGFLSTLGAIFGISKTCFRLNSRCYQERGSSSSPNWGNPGRQVQVGVTCRISRRSRPRHRIKDAPNATRCSISAHQLFVLNPLVHPGPRCP